MPYVPKEDRKLINKDVKKVVKEIVKDIKEPIDVFEKFYDCVRQVCSTIRATEEGYGSTLFNVYQELGRIIYDVARKYNYTGAWLGELNYATTRLVQEIPKILVEIGLMKTELRYWYHAEIVGYLGALTHHFQSIQNTNWIDQGFAGVFEDVKDEYKRRVNTAYEADQIIKSGDCYDTPYYTRLANIENYMGEVIGHIEIMLKRTEKTLRKDIVGTIFLRE